MSSVGSYHSSPRADLASLSAYTMSLTTQRTLHAPLVPLQSLHTILVRLSETSCTYIQGLWECSMVILWCSQFPWYVSFLVQSMSFFPDLFFLLVPQPLFTCQISLFLKSISFSCLIYDAEPWVECEPTKAECGWTSNTQCQRGEPNPYAGAIWPPGYCWGHCKRVNCFCAGRITKSEAIVECYDSISGHSEYEPFVRALDTYIHILDSFEASSPGGRPTRYQVKLRNPKKWINVARRYLVDWISDGGCSQVTLLMKLLRDARSMLRHLLGSSEMQWSCHLSPLQSDRPWLLWEFFQRP